MFCPIILISAIFSFTAYALPYERSATASAKDVAKYKSHVAYKQALVAYNRQNYEKSVERIENSLTFYASNKKSKELLVKLRLLGIEYYKTGSSLVHFNKELSADYLKKSQALLDPRDKRTLTKVSAILKELEGAETDTGSYDETTTE